MRGQQIRPSQFVLTYGVGTVIDTRDGPRIILNFEEWGQIFSHPSVSKPINSFEIRDDNVSALLASGRIFAIPTNADLAKPEEEIIYRTGLFPRWAKCERHSILYPLTSTGLTTCPSCPSGKYAQTEAIRFVRACQDGHLDDIDWSRIVHRKGKGCHGKRFRWVEGASGDLRDVKICCTDCGAEATLWDVYNGTWNCSGYHPESDQSEDCDKKAIVVLRSASNIRIPEVISALTIPPKSTNLHRVLSHPTIRIILAEHPDADKSIIVSALSRIVKIDPHLINQASIDVIQNADNDELEKAIGDCKQPVPQNLTPRTLKERELDALKYAATHGYPPDPKGPEDFEVEKDSFVIIPISARLKIRATPVKRLRIVMAQKGFRRYVRPKSVPAERFSPKLVDTFYFDGHERWYAGIELRGEGIFVDFPPRESWRMDEDSSKPWLAEFNNQGNNVGYHPLFVFWHTLSHRVIQALGLDSGYSSASIRERIYFKLDEEKREVDGGFLLYTSQPGGDGSLGGLIALVPEFENVLTTALRNIDTCSNDPLCSEQTLVRGKANGAACYACLFLSETSCEYRNLYLDRNLLRRSL